VSHAYPEPWPADPALAGNGGPVVSARRSGGRVGTLLAAVGTAVVVAGVGPLVGWLWADLSPRIPIIKVEGGFVYADAEPEQAVAADGWFAILGSATGVIFAVLAWVVLRRYRGVMMLAALAVGSLVTAALALWMGHKIGAADFAAIRDAAAVGDRLEAPLTLRITNMDADQWWLPKPTGVAAVQALVAVFVYTCLAGFSSHADLRGRTPAPQPDPAWSYGQPPYLPGQYAPPAEPYASPADPYARPADPYAPPPDPYGPGPHGQFGPGRAGSSEGATGTART
jgi:hypothetical protein